RPKATTGPIELGEVAQLPFQLRFVCGLGSKSTYRAHAISACVLEWTQFTSTKPADEFFTIWRVTTHEACGNFDTFLFRSFCCGNDATHANWISGEGFFHEYIHATLHGI